MKKYQSFLLNLIFFLIGGLLLYFAFRKQDLAALARQLQAVDYRWGILVILASFSTYTFRVLRWQLLVRTLGYRMHFKYLFSALAFGYLVNLAIPRLGEISRCLILKKNLEVPFAPLFGTVITERMIDILSLLLILGLTLFFQSDEILAFAYTNIGEPLWGLLQSRLWLLFLLIILGSILLIGLFLLRKYWLKWPGVSSLIQFVKQIWEGIKTIYYLPQAFLFLLYTVLIWIGYFLMTYLWFFALPTTQNLGIKIGLSIFMFGNLGRLVPTQGGGLGAYQFLVTEAFLLFGIEAVYGGTMAIVIHFTQIVYTLFIGSIAILYLSAKHKMISIHPKGEKD